MKTFKVNQRMIMALGAIYAYGTEHDDDDDRCESWLTIMRKLRAACLEENSELELEESEREAIEGALSYATSFYDVFNYPERQGVLEACHNIKGDEELLLSAEAYFNAMREKWVKLYGEERVSKIDNNVLFEFKGLN